MVAYSFNTMFVEQLQAGTKRQTVRADGRKRHARPGDAIQIYAGMRTKHCRKLLEDQVCRATAPIEIAVQDDRHLPISEIVVAGHPLDAEEMETFAIADGFRSVRHMGTFWRLTHGPGRFFGIVIYW